MPVPVVLVLRQRFEARGWHQTKYRKDGVYACSVMQCLPKKTESCQIVTPGL